MFLNRKNPETDDFAIKTYLFVKEIYLVEISIFQEITRLTKELADTLTKTKGHSGHIIFFQ